jgi:hypothetical protein
MKRKYLFEIGFAALGTIIVMWQLLLPGYIVTLDMVFGPSHVFYPPQGFLNGLPISILLYLFSYVIPAWLVEKALLCGIFFALFYLPLRFFPPEFELSAKGSDWIKYFAAIFYAVNPFVYERFLAGQWEVLAGYALLAPLVCILLRFLRAPRAKAALWLAAALLIIGLFSIHALVMSVIFVALAIIIEAIRLLWRHEPAPLKALIKSTMVMAVVFIFASSYWIVPLFVSHVSPIAGFGSADQTAFMTASDQYVGATGNVALLMGFWGEAYPWGKQFISPKDVSTFVPAAIVVFSLIGVGAVVSVRRRASRKAAIVLIIFAGLAWIFSMGAAGIFHGINDWLFTHLSLWRGFRDSEKWSMWLSLAYAYFGAVGAGWLVAKLTSRLRVYRLALICILLFVPIMYAAPEIGGMYGQLKPIWYPTSWSQVNDIVKSSPDCSALFLPWHLYYSLSFNNEILTADPAASFFDCDIIEGQNADIGSIDINTVDVSSSTRYGAISAAVTDSEAADSFRTVATLRQYKIQYIIDTGDLAGVDPYDYGFLTDTDIMKVYGSGSATSSIVLYALDGDLSR